MRLRAPDVTSGAAYFQWDNMQVMHYTLYPTTPDSQTVACLYSWTILCIHCSLTSAVLGWSHAKPHIPRRWAAMLQYQVIVITEENYEVRTVKAIRCKIISDNKKGNSSIISLGWNVFLAPTGAQGVTISVCQADLHQTSGKHHNFNWTSSRL